MPSAAKGTNLRQRAGFVVLVCLLLGFAGIGIPGCDQDGPAEKAGERLDDAVDDIGDAADDAADKAADKLDDAADAVD